MNHGESDGSSKDVSDVVGINKQRLPKDGGDDEDMPDIASMLSGNLLAKRIKTEQQQSKMLDANDAIGTPTNNSFSDLCLSAPPLTQSRATPQHHSQPPQYTWIMESGRGESPSPSYPNVQNSLLYQHLLGTNTLPVHFQQLLAASSLLWNPYDGRSAYLPQAIPAYPYLPFPPFAANSGKKCSNCGATSTPSWRRCPAGKNLLCNACGLYQKLHNRPRPFKIADDGSIRVQRTQNATTLREKEEIEEPKECASCGTKDTPLWRKVERLQCCNACALFHKTHGYHRPSCRTLEQTTPDSFTDTA